MNIKINRTGDWLPGLWGGAKQRAVTNAVIRRGRAQVILDRETLKQLIDALNHDLVYDCGTFRLLEPASDVG